MFQMLGMDYKNHFRVGKDWQLETYLGSVEIDTQLAQLVHVVHIDFLLPQQVGHLMSQCPCDFATMLRRVVLVRLTSLKNFSKVHIFWGLTSSRPAKIGVRCFLIPGRGNVWKKSKEQIWDEVEWQFCEIVSHPVREDKSGAAPDSTGSGRSQQFAPLISPHSPEKTTLKRGCLSITLH